MRFWVKQVLAMIVTLAVGAVATGDSSGAEKLGSETLAPVTERFASKKVKETPSFQKHVVPLMSRLGCNGRACHGSFQGRGDFRLSLFGYYFKADHDAIFDKTSPRVDLSVAPDESLIIAKPVDENEHEGGEIYARGSWEHQVFQRWIAGGAKHEADHIEKLDRLEITPSEIIFGGADDKVQLQVIAVWANGEREDVTPLCRFVTKSGDLAKVDQDGVISAGERGDTHVIVSYDKAVIPIPVMRPLTELVGKKYPKLKNRTKIDSLVAVKLRKLGIVPSEIAGDAEFLRRLRLDMTGTLPKAEEVEAFLADESPNKRARKIDELLETPAYAAWWTTVLCDATGNNDQQLTNASVMRNGASKEWYDWIYRRVAENAPYDQLVAGMVTAKSGEPGQSYTEFCEEMSDLYRDGSGKSFADLEDMTHYWARREFRNPEDRAVGFAYAFMGVRIQCAQCHKHPFDEWSKKDFDEFKKFFGGVTASTRPNRANRAEYDKIAKPLNEEYRKTLKKGETFNANRARRLYPKFLKAGKTVPFPVVYPVKSRIRMGDDPNDRKAPIKTVTSARLLGGSELDLTQYDDVRVPLMDWLRSEDNPYFARAFVNRLWAKYFNVGIVSPADDLAKANPPSNAALLDYLAKGFIDSGFDMKWVHREIANSDAYQRTWKPNETNAQDQRHFSRCVPRRLPAEVIYDALKAATASDTVVSAMHEGNDGRTIAVPGTGNGRSGMSYALKLFGRSTRESNCDCDRSGDASLLQTLYMQNDAETLAMLDARNRGWLDQVAREMGHKNGISSAGSRQVKRPVNYEERMANLQKRISQVRKNGNAKSLRQLKAQYKQYVQRFGDPNATKTAATDDEKFQPEKIVEQVYLRTLSRPPSDSEKERSTRYLMESEDKINGIRGLLWALINTKEFVVNH